jgi:zinc transport system ATP-binding protein
LVLDEPTTGVDTQNQTNLRQLLVELKIEFDLTLLMVSHDTGMIAGQVNKISCVNRSSHIHGSLESIMQHASEIEEAGCDIEAIARQQFMYKDLSGGGHG